MLVRAGAGPQHGEITRDVVDVIRRANVDYNAGMEALYRGTGRGFAPAPRLTNGPLLWG
ncbi:MAG TPA: hypothetical protein VLA19_20065 [Herpetosiphonaceae bacterium]|nr:hypothetical protein [Herpetosiphonaceae bacterium]